MPWRLADLAPAISTLLVLGALWYVAVVDQPVRIAVEGGLQFEPAHIRLKVRVEPHGENRGLDVAIYDQDGFRVTGSWEDLYGENSPITRWLPPRGAYILPASDYTAVAEVVRPGGENQRASTRFQVLSRY